VFLQNSAGLFDQIRSFLEFAKKFEVSQDVIAVELLTDRDQNLP